MTFVVPCAPRGPNKAVAVARLLASAAAGTLGQPITIENRPGAGSVIGARAMTTSAPDGHTILIGSSSIRTLPAKRAAGIDIVHIPYRGSGPQSTALLSGGVQISADGIGAPTQFFKEESLLALAVNRNKEETHADN
jgi:tripartite-type tricarboxylate transporter receptor subunit TctC